MLYTWNLYLKETKRDILYISICLTWLLIALCAWIWVLSSFTTAIHLSNYGSTKCIGPLPFLLHSFFLSCLLTLFMNFLLPNLWNPIHSQDKDLLHYFFFQNYFPIADTVLYHPVFILHPTYKIYCLSCLESWWLTDSHWNLPSTHYPWQKKAILPKVSSSSQGCLASSGWLVQQFKSVPLALIQGNSEGLSQLQSPSKAEIYNINSLCPNLTLYLILFLTAQQVWI